MQTSTGLRLAAACLVLVTVAACGADDPPVTTAEPQAVTRRNVILPGATWSYWDRGGELGAAWRAPDFDDSTWSSGAAPLGYGETYLATTVGYGPDASNKHVTTYFRTRFTVNDLAQVQHLLGRVMFDDGFVVYLNGQEIRRDSMPAGTITASTFAFGHESQQTASIYDWDAMRPLLRAGFEANVLAVEVHQLDRSSSDLVFGLALDIDYTDSIAIPRANFWKFWDHCGPPPTSWTGTFIDDSGFREGFGPLGYGESYLATIVSEGCEGPTNKRITTYFRKAFTVEHPDTVTSMIGELMWDDGVVVYLNGTRIDSASMPAGTLTATTLALGHEAGNAYTTRDWTAFRDQLLAGRNVIAVEVHQQDPASSDLVFDLSLDVRSAPPPPPPGEDIARRASWTYWDRGGDLGTAWRSAGFSDATWARGAGPLGYGESYLATTISYGPSASSKYRTSYFRNRFTVADPAAVTSLVGELMYDDGAVVYLNGTEIARRSMPAGTITASTAASSHEAGNTYTTFDWSAARGLLVAGENLITVEVHQDSSSSSDLVFDLALDVTAGGPPPPAADGIPRGASWRTRARANQQTDDWRDDEFDDSSWPALPAPIGYGEPYLRSTITYGPDPANKWVTTYFRKTFVLEEPDRVTAMVAELMYDDGIVVYLNGTQLVRRGIPGTSWPDWGDFAATREASNTYQAVDVTALRALLVPGVNVVAAEVHQDDAGSSDLVFDVALRLTLAPPPTSIARRSAWLIGDTGAGGYGTFVSAQLTTSYHRSFRVDSPAAVTQIRGELVYEDGAVIYLNGNEIARVNMPAGSITASTLASGDHDPQRADHQGHNYEAFDWTAARSFLVAGENLITVEVHQSAPDDGYARFDLALQVNTAATPRISSDCEPVTLSRYGDLEAVWVAPSGAVWAVGGNGVIGRRSTSGAWTWCTPSLNTLWSEVWGTGEADVWFVGSDGVVMRWNGVDFDAMDAGTTVELSGVWGSGPSNVYVTGRSGVIRRFDGSAWQVADLPSHHVRGVWGANATDVWVGANGCTPNPEEPDHPFCANEIYRRNPATGGFALEDDFGDESTHLFGIGGSGAADVWVVGEAYPSGAADGYGFAAHRDGTGWSDVTPPDALSGEGRMFTDVASRAPGAETGAWVTVSGNGSKGMLRWDGATWTEDHTGTDHLNGIDVRGSAMFAVGDRWKVVRWNGAGWVRDL